MNKKLIFILLCAILILGYKLREYSYASVPPPREDADEYAFAWAGLSLIKGEKPTAWSQFPQSYNDVKTVQLNIDHTREGNVLLLDFTLVKPWFDNPPLLGLITGGYAYLKGARELVDTSVIFLRRPMLKMSLLVILAVYLLAKKLFNEKVGVLAAFLYSITPVIVISSRVAIAENAYVLTFLVSLILALYWLEKNKILYWHLACLLAGVSFYFKISALAVFLSLFIFVLLYGRSKKIVLIKIAALYLFLTLAGYVLYGAIFGWKEFINVLINQTGRFYGASSEAFYLAITSSKVTKGLTDGWLNLAWISSFIIIFTGWLKDRGSTLISIALFSYLLIFLIFGSEAYGHYRIPFYPFIIISAAKVLIELYKKSNFILYLCLILLPFGTSLHRLVGVFGFQKYVSPLRLTLGLCLIIAIFLLLKRKEGLALQKLFVISTFLLTVILSILEVYFYTYEQWFFAT